MNSPAAAILVLNSGSSSLKAGLFAADPDASWSGERALLTAEVGGIGQGNGSISVRDGDDRQLSSASHGVASQIEALDAVAAALRKHAADIRVAAIGHRVVHGGPRLRAHTRITPGVLQTLRDSIHFAPLHLPAALALIDRAAHLYPGMPQFACFDTAFHATMPEEATRLPIPVAFAEQGVRRYGFHGLSYESLTAQLRAEPGRLPDRIVLAHLGGGSSLCAVKRGRSIDTTMGLTPTGGIPMTTRTGDLDPGVLLFLARAGRLSLDAAEHLVNHDAGLAAIAESSGEMRTLEAAAADGSRSSQARKASLALSIFAIAVAKQVASLTISLSGLDLLVFAGGIGEHSAAMRAAVVHRLAPFGFRLDAAANQEGLPNIHAASSRVTIRILPAQEDPVIAAHCRRFLSSS